MSDDAVRAEVEKLDGELRDWADAHIVGAATGAALTFLRAREYAEAWAQRLNVGPREARLRFLAEVQEESFEAIVAAVQDVRFFAAASPCEEDPSSFNMDVRMDVLLRRPVEQIHVTLRVEPREVS